MPLEGAPLPMPPSIPGTVGGANRICIAVERFEEYAMKMIILIVKDSEPMR